VLRRLQAGAPVEEDPYPAKWQRADGTTNKLAGFERNQEMIDDGAAVVLAFVERCPCPDTHRNGPSGMHGTHGATHCLDRAKAAGIPVKAFRPRTDT
jgi:hypothetical protein